MARNSDEEAEGSDGGNLRDRSATGSGGPWSRQASLQQPPLPPHAPRPPAASCSGSIKHHFAGGSRLDPAGAATAVPSPPTRPPLPRPRRAPAPSSDGTTAQPHSSATRGGMTWVKLPSSKDQSPASEESDDESVGLPGDVDETNAADAVQERELIRQTMAAVGIRGLRSLGRHSWSGDAAPQTNGAGASGEARTGRRMMPQRDAGGAAGAGARGAIGGKSMRRDVVALSASGGGSMRVPANGSMRNPPAHAGLLPSRPSVDGSGGGIGSHHRLPAGGAAGGGGINRSHGSLLTTAFLKHLLSGKSLDLKAASAAIEDGTETLGTARKTSPFLRMSTPGTTSPPPPCSGVSSSTPASPLEAFSTERQRLKQSRLQSQGSVGSGVASAAGERPRGAPTGSDGASVAGDSFSAPLMRFPSGGKELRPTAMGQPVRPPKASVSPGLQQGDVHVRHNIQNSRD